MTTAGKACYMCLTPTVNLFKKVPICLRCIKEFGLQETKEYQVDISHMQPEDWDIADTDPYFFGAPEK